MPDGYAATRFHAGDDPTRDSDLKRGDAGELDIVETRKDGDDATEPVRGDGFAILAEPLGKGEHAEYEATYNGVTYDAVRALGQQRGGDAGLVTIDGEASLEGLVWADADADGVRASGEGGVAGATVALTRYMRAADTGARSSGDGAAWLADGEFKADPVTTGSDGRYRFDGLPTSGYRVVEGARTLVLYGYRVNVTGMPKGYTVTPANKGGDPTADSDLNAQTTRIEPDEAMGGLTVLADNWEKGEDAGMRVRIPGLGSFSANRSHDASDLDAGLVPQGKVRIAGLVWEDANKDGLQTPGEYLRPLQEVSLDRRVMDNTELMQAGFGSTTTDGAPGSDLDAKGEPVVAAAASGPKLPEGGDSGADRSLPRVEDDGVWSPGSWSEVATVRADLKGNYAFNDLPTTDEQGRPYVYRVRMTKPDGASYVKMNAGADERYDNDYGHLNAPGAVTPENVGVTGDLAVLPKRSGGVDAWGRPWDTSRARSYDRANGNSVDLAVYVPGKKKAPFNMMLPKTGDENRLELLMAIAVCGAGVVGLGLILLLRRRKCEE